MQYIDKFLMLADNDVCDSYFLDEFSICHRSDGDVSGGRRFTGDLVEVDGQGHLHLWLFAPFRATELVSGDVIGRMFAFTQILRLTPPGRLRDAIATAARERRYDVDGEHFRRLLAGLRPEAASWNVVVCGGTGCELVGRDGNLLFQLYAPLAEWDGPARDINTWQFRETATGWDLRSLWDVAVYGQLSLPERPDGMAGRAPLPRPGDDFDIACKHDLKLKRRKGLHAEAHAALFGLAHAAVAAE
jgi:hypothetical protein